MKSRPTRVELKLPPIKDISWAQSGDPLRFYYWPVLGHLYRSRYEYCLGLCQGGQRVLEVGYGSGLALFNLQQLFSEVYGLDLLTDAADVMSAFKEKGLEAHLSQGSILEMPYEDGFFDTVLTISLLEHLKPDKLPGAMQEVHRVLKPEGQFVYGVPIQRRLMSFAFGALGYDIRKYHFSSEKEVARAAEVLFNRTAVYQMKSQIPCLGPVYEVTQWVKA